MEVLLTGWNWFFTNIFSKPYWFMGIMVFVGYLLIKKPFHEAFAGFIKAMVGYMIFNVASSGLVAAFRPILLGLNGRFNLSATVIDPYFGIAAMNSSITDAGRTLSLATMALLLGFLINIFMCLFKKVTKIRSLMVGGHVMNAGTLVFTAMLCVLCPQFSDLEIIICAGIMNGLYWAVGSNMTVEATQELTDGAGMCVGHAQMFGICIWDKISSAMKKSAEKKNKKVKKIQNLELPGFFSILNDTTVACSVVMTLFFGIMLLIIGKNYMMEIDETLTGAWGTYIIEKCFTFTVYINILTLGLRMFVGELTEAFNGISQKILKGALPAVDCAATFGFSDGSVITLSFLFGALGSVVGLGLSILFKNPLLAIVGFIPMFFDNGTLGNFAHKKAGLKGLILATFSTGLIHVFGGGFVAYYLGFAQYGGCATNFDGSVFWGPLSILLKHAGIIGVVIVSIIWIVIPQIQYARHKDTYWKVIDDYEEYKKMKGIDDEE